MEIVYFVKKPLFATDKTRDAKGLGKFFKNLVKASAEAGKN